MNKKELTERYGKPVSNLKSGVTSQTLLYMHPLIVMIMFDMSNWFMERDLEFTITDTLSYKERDKKLGRVSDSHATGRSFDLRTKHLKKWQVQEMTSYFNSKYKEIGAVTKTGKPNLVVIHGKGANIHAHVSIHSRFRLKYPIVATSEPGTLETFLKAQGLHK